MLTEHAPRNGITSLASGIIGDAHQLLQQEIALAKAEFQVEVAKFKAANLASAVGMAVILLGCVPIPFLLTDLIVELGKGAIPKWGAYLMVSLSLIGIGWAVLALLNRKSRDAFELPKIQIGT